MSNSSHIESTQQNQLPLLLLYWDSEKNKFLWGKGFMQGTIYSFNKYLLRLSTILSKDPALMSILFQLKETDNK